MTGKKVTRRQFVADTGKIGLGVMIVPRHVLGGPGFQAPSDTINFAVAGFGGMGSENALELAKTENLVAYADVDFAYSASKVAEKLKDDEKKGRPEGITLKQKFDKATRYSDFREMLDKQKDIDGVVIATPDHLHAVIAKAAMQTGKHVYVQKPLTYSVHEARVLRDLALANPKIVTQMGNQGHSSDGARLINEWIQAGIIGPVREVHVWTNRPVVYWPQGVPRPTGAPPPPPPPSPFGNPFSFRYVNQLLASALGSHPAPPGLNWDLYVGPVAEEVPYHPIYHPFNWRGWINFGVGALGDMGAHLIDHPFWALGLTYPTSIEATSTQWGTMPIPPDPKAAAGAREARGYNKP
ncbi:MAG TPA: Gfo/Idh/MocA family oxidoreductase, partial [Gemmatimonadaceae bacterium]